MYEIVFVLTGPDKDKLPEENRALAAKIMLQQGMTKEIIVAGGSEIYLELTEVKSVKRAERLAKMIGNAKFLVSEPYTSGNFIAIKKYCDENKVQGNLGIMTAFWHIPRAIRMMLLTDLHLTPICAEAILLMSGSPECIPTIKQFFSLEWQLNILREIQGLADLEAGKYNFHKM